MNNFLLLISVKMDDDYILFLLNTLGQIYSTSGKFDDDNNILIDTNSTNFTKLVKNNEDNYKIVDDYVIKFDIKFLLEISKITIKYNTLILEYPKNRPMTSYKWYDREGINNDRQYIKINEPYNKITISSKIKKSAINLEDILFASSLLSVSKDEYLVNLDYEGYKKINSVRNVIMCLRPGFNNLK